MNVLRDKPPFEETRLKVPPWPTDPDERAELVRAALECEQGWRNAEGLRIHLQMVGGKG